MPVTGAPKQEGTQHLLHEACARNTSAEVHVEDRKAGTITARARLLDVDSARIYLDRPQAAGQTLALSTRQLVTVYFLLNGTRYAFRSRVDQPRCMVRLNAKQQVPGSALTLPDDIRRQQRRADFRLSLAAFEELRATVHAGTADTGGAAPLDALRCSARLLNISAGGVGAMFDTSLTRHWKTGDVFFLEFELPEVENPFLVMVELRHTRRIHGGLSVVTGFKFLPWPLVPLHAYTREITRFIATAQRRRLRRSR